MTKNIDYRGSHLKKGNVYDSILAKEAFSIYSESLQKAFVERFIEKKFNGVIPRYLDFACGTGRMTKILAPMAAESFGIDVSESMIAEARKKCPETSFILKDATRKPLDLQPMNLVTAFRFFGNAEDSLRRDALVAIRKALKPGGYLIFNNHRNPGSISYRFHLLRGGSDEKDFSYGKMLDLVREAGFRIETVYGIGWWSMAARLGTEAAVGSRLARVLEPLSRLPLMARICPDMLVVARKED